ncbi:hypothetical protein DVH24_028617 [Malus domestica]|uniref:Pentacotripeptide-repeat region of PRORP domain-containing protein n=1 Tax=Malus domestica TaxID=3750 RepID=A0A498IXR4_MALDO|nr:hypothetical protein DVH24_028617 [Malus domestica]
MKELGVQRSFKFYEALFKANMRHSRYIELGVQRSFKFYEALFKANMRHSRYMMVKGYFNAMLSERIEPIRHTYKLCESLDHARKVKTLTCKKTIHGFVKKHDKVALNMFVGYALIELYYECGEMGETVKVFDEFSLLNVFFMKCDKKKAETFTCLYFTISQQFLTSPLIIAISNYLHKDM